MPRPLPSCFLATTALLSIACPETEAQRGRDALQVVAASHKELFACHRRHAQAFAATQAGAQARTQVLWATNPLGDVEGLLISKNLLISYVELQARSAPRDLPANARRYLEQRADLAKAAAEALERAEPVAPASFAGQVRAASQALWREDEAIVRKYLAALDARGR